MEPDPFFDFHKDPVSGVIRSPDGLYGQTTMGKEYADTWFYPYDFPGILNEYLEGGDVAIDDSNDFNIYVEDQNLILEIHGDRFVVTPALARELIAMPVVSETVAGDLDDEDEEVEEDPPSDDEETSP